MTSDTIAADQAGKTILSAFRFLENVGEQIKSLQTTLKSKFQSSDELKKLGVTCKFTDSDYEMDVSKWLARSEIYQFEIYLRGKSGPKKPIIYAAFQISLAPSRPSADERFFPHLAVLLAGLRKGNDWEQWECEEFQLDDEFLADSWEDGGDFWKRDEKDVNRWVSARGEPAVALAIPLTKLKDEEDVKKLVMDRIIVEIKAILNEVVS